MSCLAPRLPAQCCPGLGPGRAGSPQVDSHTLLSQTHVGQRVGRVLEKQKGFCQQNLSQRRASCHVPPASGEVTCPPAANNQGTTRRPAQGVLTSPARCPGQECARPSSGQAEPSTGDTHVGWTWGSRSTLRPLPEAVRTESELGQPCGQGDISDESGPFLRAPW